MRSIFGSGRRKRSGLQIQGALQEPDGRARRQAQCHAGGPVRIQSLRRADDLAGDRRLRKGRRRPARDVRRKSSGLPGSTASSNPPKRNWRTIYSGGRLCISRNAAASRSSTDPTTRKCWSSACVPRNANARAFRTRAATTARSGASVIVRSTIFEEHLDFSGTKIIKLFLHLSKDEQRKRFLARIDDRKRTGNSAVRSWKRASIGDDYRKAYEECLGAARSSDAPWYVVPADDKENARLIVSQIVLDRFEKLDLDYPETTPKRARELQAIRKELTK